MITPVTELIAALVAAFVLWRTVAALVWRRRERRWSHQNGQDRSAGVPGAA